MTVGRLLRQIDSAEISEWQAFYLLERQEYDSRANRPEVGSDASMQAELTARAQRGLAATDREESARH